MSVNLLLSPNSKDLYMSKLTTPSIIYDVGATTKLESGDFISNAVVINADTDQVTGSVYISQVVRWCIYSTFVLFNITLEYTSKGTAGSGPLFIDLPTSMPESENGYLSICTARFGITNDQDDSNGYAQFDEGTRRLRLYRDFNNAIEYEALTSPGYIFITGSYFIQQQP